MIAVRNKLGQSVDECVRYHSLTLWRNHHRLRSKNVLARSARQMERVAASYRRTNVFEMAAFYAEVASKLRALVEGTS